MLEAYAVKFGHFMLGRGGAVVELAIVGDQQHAGGVGIEPADRLHVDVAHVVGKQAEHARVLLRFVRGFVVGRFVEQNIEIGQRHHGKRLAVDFERADVGRLDIFFRAVVCAAVERHAIIFNQPQALLAAADALRLQIF